MGRWKLDLEVLGTEIWVRSDYAPEVGRDIAKAARVSEAVEERRK